MKFRKLIAAGLASVTLLSTTTTTVDAADNGSWKIVKRSAPVYNKKGKKIYRGRRKFRHLLKAKKGDFYVILGTKKLKNKKFYEVQKNYFLKASDAKLTYEVNKKVKEKWPSPNWQSKHLVDNSSDLPEEIYQAFSMIDVETDYVEALQEVANQMNMLDKQTGQIQGGQQAFENKLINILQNSNALDKEQMISYVKKHNAEKYK